MRGQVSTCCFFPFDFHCTYKLGLALGYHDNRVFRLRQMLPNQSGSYWIPSCPQSDILNKSVNVTKSDNSVIVKMNKSGKMY